MPSSYASDMPYICATSTLSDESMRATCDGATTHRHSAHVSSHRLCGSLFTIREPYPERAHA